MDEFDLIDHYFNTSAQDSPYLKLGIGDDAAILSPAADMDLLVSTDTQVSGVHFLPEWPAHRIAIKSVAVNVSDIVAMGGIPRFISMALTLPKLDTDWLEDFAKGVQQAMRQYDLCLIGGDTTRGPLSITITIHGTVSQDKAVRRDRAQVGDVVFVSGCLGAAALALQLIDNPEKFEKSHRDTLLQALQTPNARTDMITCLQAFATAAIDISDGLSADLQHICTQSQLACLLDPGKIPLHPLLQHYLGANALDRGISGGDDYEICFTVNPAKREECLAYCHKKGLSISEIGRMCEGSGLYFQQKGEKTPIRVSGYKHF